MIVHPAIGEHVSFFAAGLAETKGSFIGLGGGRVKADNPREKGWHDAVAWAAKPAMRRKLPLTGGALVTLDFFLPMPVGKKNKRDVDKLCRSCLDAMTGLVYIDDEDVRCLVAAKEVVRPTAHTEQGVEIHVFQNPGCRAVELVSTYFVQVGR